ncbi:MAG: MBL fold metallo-hydrolase [Cytophagaceae bacterium]|nr:MBL fold metallo-hydrolase [Cytophagaceae bacterium]MDW8456979.1 MBL fold metallo-hydrolase [Cytophagaceae bacterium]
MIVTILGSGTSQGIPIITCTCAVCSSSDFRDKRLRTSIHIAVEDKSFVIDTGPDFRQQMLRERIRKLDAIIYTHEHKDHISGLDDVRSFNNSQQRHMDIYAHKRVLDAIKKDFSYAFEEKKYPGVPLLNLIEITNQPFHIYDIPFQPIEVLHYKLPIFAYRIYNFAYITDASYISEQETEKLKNVDVLIINALQKTFHISHFTLDQALQKIEIIRPKRAYLTHISHTMGLHRDVEKELPENVKIAYDGLKIKID